MNLPNFWYGSCSYGPLWENHTLYAGKIMIWQKFWPFVAKIWPFLAKIDSFKSLWPITFKHRYNSSSFLAQRLFWWSSLRKSYSICQENSDMAKFWPFKTRILATLCQNWQFWKLLASSFQTPLWIFLIFGMEVVLMVFFEKIMLDLPGKFWYGKILAFLRPKFGIFESFWPNTAMDLRKS